MPRILTKNQIFYEHELHTLSLLSHYKFDSVFSLGVITKITLLTNTTHKQLLYYSQLLLTMAQEFSPCCCIIAIVLVLIIVMNREFDENGMDSYDRQYGIAKEGLTRGRFGTIYRNGEYSFWDNMFDHNPYYY